MKQILLKPLRVALFAFLLYLCVLCLPCPCRASLQKTGRPQSIVVVDMAKERAAASDHAAVIDEVYLCILSIQGIVNRDSSGKIYLVNGPNGWTDNGYGFRGAEDLDQWELDQGMVPCRHTRPVMDMSKPYPALSYLIEHYRNRLKGRILIPSFQMTNAGSGGPYALPADPLFPTDNAVAAAATCAGQTDCILCSPAVDAYLRGVEGWRAPLTIDCTALTSQEAAYDWASKNYFRASTNRSSVRLLRNGIKPEMFNSLDYFIATRSFVTTADAHFQTSRFLDLMSRYPQGTVCFVNYEYSDELSRITDAGYGNAIITGCNLSVFSGFPTDPRVGAGVKPPVAQHVPGPHDAYLGFYVTDGDSFFCSNCWHILDRKNGRDVGSVPIGWSFNPMLMDLKPTLLAWESAHNYGSAFETVADMLDGPAPNTAAGTARYAADLRAYMDHAGGAFRTVNFLYGSHSDHETCRLAAPYLALFGYSGNTHGGGWRATSSNNGATLEAGMDGETQQDATIAEIEQTIQNTLHSAPPNAPCFMIVCLGDGVSAEKTCGQAARIARDLQNGKWSDPAQDGRTFHFLRPCDVAETYKVSRAIP